MLTLVNKRVDSGFSLIEVMIAVVVLATGLLALAALQAKLTTNSADAKARSRIAALMTSVIDFERARGYGSIAEGGPTTYTCDATVAAPSIENLICVAQSDAGVSGISLKQTVTRYYGDPSSASFSTTVPGAGVSIYGDYKEIELTANWTDATGSARSLASNTITSNLDLNANSSTVLSQNLTASASLNPVVHETNPGNTAGVIPIAIGSGTGEFAASTNPKPTVSSSGANSTTFNTLNYASDANASTATIQKRIETEVAECVCKGSSSNPFGSDTLLGQNKFRPSYWDGTRYVAPEIASGTPSSSAATSVTQSAECDICCRDHNDTGVATTEVRYDAVTGDTKRYKVAMSGSNIVTPVELEEDGSGNPVAADVTSDAYLDACRFIRVDGLWRAATDIQATHVGLIATNDEQGVATNKSAPYADNQTLYETFVVNAVKAYLNSALPTNGSPEWSNFLTSTIATIFSTSAPDVPTTTPVLANTTGTYRYLHAHGLYIDYLESDAIDKLNAIVSSSCKVTDAKYPNCLLAYLPFSTINISGLANWFDANDSSDAAGTSPLGKTVLDLGSGTSTSTTCGNGTSFGGCVKGLNTGYADATASIGHSNSGIAASIAVSPYERDDTKVLSAKQKFKVGSTSTSDLVYVMVTGPDLTPTGFNFVQNFTTSSLNSNVNPTVAWSTSSLSDFCSPNSAKKAASPNPYSCKPTVSFAMPTTITVGGASPSKSYNQLGNAVVYSENPCPGATGNAKHVGVTVKGLVCYKLSTATLTDASNVRIDCNTTTNPTSCYNVGTPTVQNSGTVSESTTINIQSVTGTPAALTNATLNTTFIYSASKVGSYTCDTNKLPVAVDPTTCN